MREMLKLRENLVALYKRREFLFNLAFKFLAGLYVVLSLSAIGGGRSAVPAAAGALSVFMLAGFLAVLPSAPGMFLLSVYVCLRLSGNIALAAAVFLVLLCVLLFYARMAPKESPLIILTLLAYKFHAPCFAPLIAGLYFGPSAVLPVTIGVFLRYCAPEVLAAAGAGGDLSLTALPETAGDALGVITAAARNYAWVFVAFVFSMAALVTCAIRRLSISHARELAVALGGATCFFGLLLVRIMGIADISVLGSLASCAASVALALVVSFFDIALDYGRARTVEFSDERNYYYVRIIPKLGLQDKPEKNAGRRSRAPRRKDRSE
ncbi:MAG: hypothetical protein LBU36_03080 [Clostridiales bacterium]|jgi:hypothetical protein|nr:hypothetical protein [Clostridiales bacterium]